MKNSSGIRFIGLSFIGAVLFFLPVYQGMIPVVLLINAIKLCLGELLPLVAVISCTALAVELAAARIFKIPVMEEYFKGERIRCLFWLLSAVIVLLKAFGSTLPFLVHPNIGGTILNLGSTVFITIAAAGCLVIFIIQSGIVEFVSVLMEPVMQPMFRLPGEAAVNILSSFVSSASVGVYFTERYYLRKRYTTRQACTVVTSFSVVSVGYSGIIASVSGIGDMYGELLAGSFFLVLLMGMIMVRIPPLCRMADCYIDGSEKVCGTKRLGWRCRLAAAWEAGVQKAGSFTGKAFFQNLFQALTFAQRIVGVMIPTVLFVLILVYYTPLFTWLGYPLIPVLQLLGIPDAALAAPSVLIGIVEVSLPGILIGGSAAAQQTRFFVALLSIVQIIFFSEAGNAIMGSKIPLNAGKLIVIFLVRTAIALPLVSLVTHIIY